MPRAVKRKGRGKARPQPKLPEGEEGQGLTADERRAKLELFLDDFDNEVVSRVEIMRSEAKKEVEQLKVMFMCEMMKIPSDIKKKKYKDYLSSGEQAGRNSLEKVDQAVDEIMETLKSAKPKSTVKKAPKPTTTKKTRRGRAAAAAPSENMPPPTTGRKTRTTRTTATMRQEMCTPGWSQQQSNSTPWPTPLLTPKFDPRLPPTERRKARPGEATVRIHMSLAGSPLAERDSAGGDKKTIGTAIEDLQGMLTRQQLGNLDPATIVNLQKLGENLSNLAQLSQSSLKEYN